MEKNIQQLANTPENDLGIGNKVIANTRLIDKNGKFRVYRSGEKIWMHPYQRLIEMSWLRFHILIVAFYIIINIFFAIAYMLIGEGALSGEYHGSLFAKFFKAYFFSIQTFTTVGYGSIAPMCFSSNVIAAFEALLGLLIFALATGLYYAKFTRPSSKINFSNIAVIAPYKEGINGFMMRMVNHSYSELIEMEAIITYSWLQTDKEGVLRRSYSPIALERQKVALFPLNWTLVHPIDDKSPLWGKNQADLIKENAEFIVFTKGLDTTFGQMVQATSSYLAKEVLWNYKFEPMYYSDETYGTVLELDKINNIISVTS
jgi:inward rectifier potassium channel